jgi:hypothetical protein
LRPSHARPLPSTVDSLTYSLTHQGKAKEGHFYEEVEFRTALEEHLCRRNESLSLATVMVLLAIGGGIGTLQTVESTLRKRRPVVVLAHSGGASFDICERAHACAACTDDASRVARAAHTLSTLPRTLITWLRAPSYRRVRADGQAADE